MAKQKIVWTAIPYGRVPDGPLRGRLRVSLVVSPRLTPVTAQEQQLGAADYVDFHNWPKTLQQVKLQLQINGVPGLVPLEVISKASPELWDALLPSTTPVAGFVFKDMSRVNLRSYAVRNVLGFVREHYGNLAAASASEHPTLLPWKNADGALKGMLTAAGTRTQKINFGDRSVEVPAPGFDRFFDARGKDNLNKLLQGWVFSSKSRYQASVVGIGGMPTPSTFPIRVLPADWQDPAAAGPDAALMSQFSTAAEYTLFQANRFYKRTQATDAELAMRRPDQQNLPPAVKLEELDFHRITASLADYGQVLRGLGLIIDCALPDDNAITKDLLSQPVMEGAIGVEV